MDGLDAAHRRYPGWGRDPVKRFAVDIPDKAALRTDEVMMAFGIRIKPGPVPYGPHTADDALPLKHPQCSVDRIQRYGRNAPAHTRIERLRIRMFLRAGQFAEYFRSLMGGPDTVPAAGVRKFGYPLLHLCCRDHGIAYP